MNLHSLSSSFNSRNPLLVFLCEFRMFCSLATGSSLRLSPSTSSSAFRVSDRSFVPARVPTPHRSAAVVRRFASNHGFGAKPSSPSSSSPFSSSATTQAAKNELPIPASREEAVSQAAAALAASLSSSSSSNSSSSSLVASAEALSKKRKKASGKAAKGFARPTQPARATIEVPIADESPAATAALAVDLIESLGRREDSKPATRNARLIFGDVDAALTASDLLGDDSPVSVSALDDDDGDGGDDDDSDESGEGEEEAPCSLVVVVAPTPQQAPRAAALLSSKRFRSRDAVLLNAKWEASAPPAGLSGFSAAYAFVPLAIQGFLGATTTAGVMLCARVPGGTPQPLWRIYKDESGRGDFAVVGRSQKRPGPRDIEDAFYNSAAASSPVTKGFAAIRGMLTKK